MSRERPILFSAEMTRAILRGAKTQTRRPVDMRHVGFIGGRNDDHDDPALWGFCDINGCWHVLGQKAKPWAGSGVPHESYAIACPYGGVGTRLWVREAFALIWPSEYPPERVRDHEVQYRADWPNDKYPGHWTDDCGDDPACGRWRPSIHMPRWASRITLEITEVRVERLQDISEEDCRAEGFPLPPGPGLLNGEPATIAIFDPRLGFRHGWTAVYGKRSPWDRNDWVRAISFKRVEQGAGNATA